MCVCVCVCVYVCARVGVPDGAARRPHVHMTLGYGNADGVPDSGICSVPWMEGGNTHTHTHTAKALRAVTSLWTALPITSTDTGRFVHGGMLASPPHHHRCDKAGNHQNQSGARRHHCTHVQPES